MAAQASGQKHRSMVHQSCGTRAAFSKLRHDLVEVQKAEAERRMRGGLVLAVLGLCGRCCRNR